MIKVASPFPEFRDYVAVSGIMCRGPLATCVVQSVRSSESFDAEWIDASNTSGELFGCVDKHWRSNERCQPTGSLKQLAFFGSHERVSRIIETPRGRPLNEFVFQRRHDVATSLTTAIELATCLADWHTQSRTHGWLNGECVYCEESGKVQLRDVSAVHHLAEIDFSLLDVHDIAFLSPESSGSLAREVSPASDLYSLGVMLFAMLSGRAPIEASNASEYLNQQLCVEAPRLREFGLDISKPLDDLVARLLFRDPRDRYQTANALLDDLRYIADLDTTGDEELRYAVGTSDIRKTMTEAAFVGYEADLSRTQLAIQSALSGTCCVQLITGPEAGVRRNYIDEIEMRAASVGMAVLRGGASTTTNPKPLQSLDTVFSAITTICNQDPALATRLAELTQEHSATLIDLLPNLASYWQRSLVVTGPDAYGGQRVQVALEDLFVALAKEPSGAAFLFDDLHAADELTRNVVRSLIERTQNEDTRFLFCAISSDSADALSYGESLDAMHLGPLSDDALQRHLESMAGKLSDTIKSSIVEVADGNVTIASAMLRRMIDSKAIKLTDQGWVPDGVLRDALRHDETFTGLLECQIDELSSRALNVLSTAAVVGQRFELAILADVSKQRYADVLEVVTEALGRRLLWRDSQQGWFRFANDPIHRQLCSSVSDDVRKELHRRTAAYLKKHTPDNVYDLAFHYDAAEISDLALEYSLEAAASARHKHSLSVAEDQLCIAKRWVAQDDLATRLIISGGLGEIHLLTGRYDAAGEYLHEALSLATTPLDKARIQQQIGELAFKRGRFADAATEYQQALSMTGARVPLSLMTMLLCLALQTARQVIHAFAPKKWIARRGDLTPLDCLRMQLLSQLSRVYWFSRHRLWTLGNHLRSLNEAELYNPSETLAAVYSEHGPVMSLLRWFGRANQYFERSLVIRRQRGDVWGQGQSYHYGSVVKLAECQFQDAIETSHTAVEMLRQTGDFWEMNMARYQGANAFYRIGCFSEAVQWASKMYESGREIGDLQASGISLDVWARCSPETLPLDMIAEDAAQDRPDAQSHAQSQLAYAVVLLHHGQLNDGIDTLVGAIERCRNAGHLNTYISPCYAWLGTARRQQVEVTDCRDGHRRKQRIRDARTATRKALKIAKFYPADLAHCWREIAALDEIEGDIGKAVAHLKRSVRAAQLYAQRAEELESLQILAALHDREIEQFGPLPLRYQLRLDELLKTVETSQQGGPSVGDADANLSLADRFVTLLKSGRRIAQALTASGVYIEASESARRLLRGQNADVVMVRSEQGDFQFEAASALPFDEQCQCRIDANVDLVRVALQQGYAVCRNDNTLETNGKPNTANGSTLAAPILFRGHFVAVILVSHSELSDLFGKDELRIADFVTTLAGAALENADGFLQLRQMNDTLEQRVLERTQAAEDRAKQLAEKNSQLHETEEQLREAMTVANAANAAKGRFLATMSHEIRTPLNGILGMTRLAQQSSVDGRQKGYLDTVQESGQSLLNLINDLLDFSKLEAGKMVIEEIPFRPQELAGEVSRLMGASAWQKGLELSCELAPDLPQILVGDPSKLRQIIVNLVGNALKFTAEGSVALMMQATPRDHSSIMLSIAVKDSGLGIPIEKQEKVFESFSQADSSTTRRFGGTGLGLAICRELAEKMNGTIELESAVGFGSTFTVTIPLAIAEGDTAEIDITEIDIAEIDTAEIDIAEIDIAERHTVERGFESESQPHLSKENNVSFGDPCSSDDSRCENRSARILVAEDGVINQEVIVGILEMEGYEVVVANDGQEAVERAAEQDFDICLMDVDMPKMDGMDATRAIRASMHNVKSALPIVAMTAHSGDQIWGQCKEAGMDGHLPKPIQPDKLFETIERYGTIERCVVV
ncbi:Sensory/regulatory protein RpfC [Planctomycetes bacterium CA13]|uniref:histidine kinase n=1 Tax=Novipirellula herctigrandis TaxID=2527986 RepID=A0A5C5ZA50_9BACT|nr:Sensory/regulatory protein RpfC [Planctomycetes bacterium CA13]